MTDLVELANLLEPESLTYGIVQPGNHDPSGVPIVRVSDLADGSISQSSPLRVSAMVESKFQRSRLSGGELLLSIVGTVGRVARVPDSMRGWNIARAIAVLRPSEAEDIEWIRYCLQSPVLQRDMKLRQTDTVQATLNLRDVKQLQIPYPSKSQRNRVIQVLGALDDLIDTNRSLANRIEDVLAHEFAAAGFDDDPGDSGVRLGDLIDVNPKYPKPTSTAAYIDMAALPTDSARILGVEVREARGGARFKNGDTLLARITPCLENGKTGFVDSLADGEIGVGSTEFIVLRSSGSLGPYWSYFLARSDRFREFAIQNMTGTSGRQRCPADAVERYLVSFPDARSTARFADAAAALFPMLKELDDEAQIAARTRDELLPLLVSGGLRVRDLAGAV